MDTKSSGERTEAVVLAELLKEGYVVLLPFGDNQRYNMVVESAGRFIRIQCKTARMRGIASFSFKVCSTYAHRNRPQRTYRGDADVFAVYLPDNGQVYMIPVDEVGVSEARLQLAGSLRKHGRVAESYLLKDWVPSEVSHSGVA